MRIWQNNNERDEGFLARLLMKKSYHKSLTCFITEIFYFVFFNVIISICDWIKKQLISAVNIVLWLFMVDNIKPSRLLVIISLCFEFIVVFKLWYIGN